MKIPIAIADDQQLFLRSLSKLIDTFAAFTVTAEAVNGEELLKQIATAGEKPAIVLLDVHMPVMDGIQTAGALLALYPAIKVVALSMKDDDTTIINMIKAGACAFLLKDIHPDELEKALVEIDQKGYYNADAYNLNHRRLLSRSREEEQVHLSDRERTFLQLSCSDLTYKQIAAAMCLSDRTIDGYREAVFAKFNVASRVGMVLEALRRKIVHI